MCPANDTQAHRELVSETCARVGNWLQEVRGGKVILRRGRFTDERLNCTRAGCEVGLTGSFSALGEGKSPELMIEELLETQGWVRTRIHDADGPDGTTFSLHKPGALCIVQGSWNHWDDEDGPHLEDYFQTTVACGLGTTEPPALHDIP